MMKTINEAVQALLEQTGLHCVRMGRAMPGNSFPYIRWGCEMLDNHLGMITAVCRCRDADAYGLDVMRSVMQLVPEKGLLLRPDGMVIWLWREGCTWERDPADPRATAGTVRLGFVAHRECESHAV